MKKTFAMFLIVGFLFVGAFGFLHGIMSHDSHTPCPFMAISTICEMNAFEHVLAWKKTFIYVLTDFSLVLYSVFIYFVLLFLKKPANKDKLLLKIREIFKIKLNVLEKIFSDGILNPKAP